MAFHKPANPVLANPRSPHLFCQVLDDLTGWWHCPVSKVVNSLNQNLLFFIRKALAPKRVGLLLGLSETPDVSRNSLPAAFVFLCCIRKVYKLPSLNCSHCGINPLRFSVVIAHFVVVVIRFFACFEVERVLRWELGYSTQTCGGGGLHRGDVIVIVSNARPSLSTQLNHDRQTDRQTDSNKLQPSFISCYILPPSHSLFPSRSLGKTSFKQAPLAVVLAASDQHFLGHDGIRSSKHRLLFCLIIRLQHLDPKPRVDSIGSST
jgi:hypothetical protein